MLSLSPLAGALQPGACVQGWSSGRALQAAARQRSQRPSQRSQRPCLRDEVARLLLQVPRQLGLSAQDARVGGLPGSQGGVEGGASQSRLPASTPAARAPHRPPAPCSRRCTFIARSTAAAPRPPSLGLGLKGWPPHQQLVGQHAAAPDVGGQAIVAPRLAGRRRRPGGHFSRGRRRHGGAATTGKPHNLRGMRGRGGGGRAEAERSSPPPKKPSQLPSLASGGM